MTFSRRAFLATLSSAIAGAVIDPDLLKWEKGAKTYFDQVGPRLTDPKPGMFQWIGVTSMAVGSFSIPGYSYAQGEGRLLIPQQGFINGMPVQAGDEVVVVVGQDLNGVLTVRRGHQR